MTVNVKFAPIYQSIGMPFLELGRALDRESVSSNSGYLSKDRADEIIEAICLLVGTDVERLEIIQDMKSGIALLEKITGQDVEELEEIHNARRLILMGMFKVAISVAGARVKEEYARVSPLSRQNEAKEEVIQRARVLAQQFWIEDVEQVIRITKMADKVYRALNDEGFGMLLPGESLRVKEWIKPVAPNYAQKAGRARKTS